MNGLAYLFPGQGSQYPSMGKALFDTQPLAQQVFMEANEILGFKLTDKLFFGTAEDLKQTQFTQLAIYTHSIAAYKSLCSESPSMLAGHSLGEFSALVASGCVSFKDGLQLVNQRAQAMQAACEAQPSAMAAVLGKNVTELQAICETVKNNSTNDWVVIANYNSPTQLVISGTENGIYQAIELLKKEGAKAIKLPVGGAFHSPRMQPARVQLAQAINNTAFAQPICPIYMNVTGRPTTDPMEIKTLLIEQLTAPVRWFQTIEQMIADGVHRFLEVGPGKVLQGLVKKINSSVNIESIG